MDVPNWEFGGSTVVSTNYVRLTPDRQSKNGMLWNTVVMITLVVRCINQKQAPVIFWDV